MTSEQQRIERMADEIARLREALLDARRFWLEMAVPRDPEHAGVMADKMDTLFDVALGITPSVTS